MRAASTWAVVVGYFLPGVPIPEPEVTWTKNAGKDCDLRIPADFNHAGFLAALCSAPGASGAIPELDGPGSPAVCLGLAAMQSLCAEIEECHSVTFQGDHGGRGYLNTYSCSSAAVVVDEPTSDMYIKSVGSIEKVACPLGRGVDLVGGPYADVQGAYAAPVDSSGDPIPGIFLHADYGSGAKIVWMGENHSAEGCGWSVMRPVPASARRMAQCRDNTALLRQILHDEAATCETMAAWRACGAPLVRAVCPESCGADCADAPDCNGACEDELDAALCPTTCAAQVPVAPARALAARAVMRDAPLLARQLGYTVDGAFEEVYRTFWKADSSNCSATLPEEEDLDKTSLYDVKKWLEPVPIKMEHACPGGVVTFETMPGMYLPRENVPARYSTNKKLVLNACYEKCYASRETNYTDKIVPQQVDTFSDDLTENDWCSGYETTMTPMTNAICLPREECEALCLEIEDCASIDMHRYLPRCYLNRLDSNHSTANMKSDSTYDVLLKSTTPGKEEAGADDKRDTYVTYTGKEYPWWMSSVLDTYATSSRTACEVACSSNLLCTGFRLRVLQTNVLTGDGGVPSCDTFRVVPTYDATDRPVKIPPPGPLYINLTADSMYDNIPVVSAIQMVLKVPHDSCTVTVTGDITYAGLYVKVEPVGGLFSYLAGDNATRLAYHAGRTGKQCDEWRLEANQADPIDIILRNCTDYPGKANALAKLLNPKAPTQRHPCQTGYDEGLCNDDAFFGLCSHTCLGLNATLIAGVGCEEGCTYTHQKTEGWAHMPNSSCRADNNGAAHTLKTKYLVNEEPLWTNVLTTPLTACYDLAIRNRNFTHSACSGTEIPWAGIFSVMCKKACAVYPATDDHHTVVTIPPYIPDETSPTGALDRRLGVPVYTTSYYHPHTMHGGTPPHDTITVSYLPGDVSDSFWDAEFKSAVNGSLNSSVMPGGECTYGNSYGSQGMYDQLDRDTMFPYLLPTAPVTLGTVCRNESFCGEFLTCVITGARMDEELSRQFGASITSGFLTDAPLAERQFMFQWEKYPARAIISEHRAAAILMVVGDKWMLTNQLYRNVPSAPVVVIQDITTAAAAVVVQMVSATAALGYYAQEEFGTTYAPLGTGWSDWVSDVVRIEAFSDAGVPVPVTVSFKLKVLLGATSPALLRVYKRSAAGGGYELVSGVSYVGEDDLSNSSSVFLVNDAITTGTDFIAVVDINECLASPCDMNAVCANTVPGYTCTCDAASGYTPVTGTAGTPGNCAIDPLTYTDAKLQDTYFRITHLEKLSFGWWVDSVELYEDAACTTKLAFDDVKVAFPAEAADDATYQYITKESFVYSGPIGKAHYPYVTDKETSFQYWNKNIFGTGEWRSACLQCEAGATSLEFIIKAGTRVDCVKVIQTLDHQSNTLLLERGPVQPARGEDAGCGMRPTESRCEPFMQNIVSELTATTEGPTATFTTSCGEDKVQSFAEILKVGTFVGSYPNSQFASGTQVGFPVKSPCHCMQLCVAHLTQGCAGYKFFEDSTSANPIKHCFLLGEKFAPGKGYYGKAQADWEGWVSGTPSQRYVKQTTTKRKLLDKPWLFDVTIDPPMSAGSDVPFTATVTGVNMPTTSTDLQRLKFVPAGTSCDGPMPEEITGVACVPTTTPTGTVYTFCGPGPSLSSSTSASWSGLLLTSSEADVQYTACYCAFDCAGYDRWQPVPGVITVLASVFMWSAGPVYREGSVALRVWRPAFGSHSPNRDWEVKLVRDYFSCELEMDATIFGFNITTDSDCTGPDVCDYSMTVSGAVADAGEYFVCFLETPGSVWKPIAGADGSKLLTVHLLSTDYTKPSGVFHNHYFSAQAGGATTFSIKAAEIVVPARGRLLPTKGACGDPKTHAFTGAAVKAKPDALEPLFNAFASTPANLTTVSSTEVLSLAFSERVVIPEDCVGRFMLYAEGAIPVGTPAVAWACDDPSILVFDNRVVLPPPATGLPSGTMFLLVETGAVNDLSGNRNTIVNSVQSWSFTVNDASDDVLPSVVKTEPDLMTHTALSDTNVTFYFSELVTPKAGEEVTVSLTDCSLRGSPWACEPEDDVVKRYVVTEKMFVANELSVDIGKIAAGKRYKVSLPRLTMDDSNGNIGPYNDTDVEFVLDSGGFDADVHTLDVDLLSSTSEGFDVTAAFTLATEPGLYNVCYCDEYADTTLEVLGDGEFAYSVNTDARCESAGAIIDGAIIGLPLADHGCATKCAMGCVGTHCYCEGYEASLPASTLCLPKPLCAQACADSAACVAFSVHDEKPQCELATSCSAATGEAAWTTFAKMDGASCTHVDDFRAPVGQLVISGRVDIGVDYIFTPGVEGSIEITNPPGMSFMRFDKKLSEDRITVIDCGGSCGVSRPTGAVTLPANAGSIATWTGLVSFNNFVDVAWDDEQNTQDTETIKYGTKNEVVSRVYTAIDNSYVPGDNLEVGSYQVVLMNDVYDLSEHQCYAKCKSPCEGPRCFCSGYLHGYDYDTSNALCADQNLCEFLCDSIAECGSIDMHKDLDRCFLNGKDIVPLDYRDGTTHLDSLLPDKSYKVLVPRTVARTAAEPPDGNEEIPHDSQLGPLPDPVVVVKDHGFSWSNMLRFKGIKFLSGGTFKLCFCDSTLVPSCKSERDFTIEVGKIHVSGVSCLISQPSLRSAACVEQYYGDAPKSLRCYAAGEPPALSPPPLALKDEVKFTAGAAAPASTQCAYGPEEGGCPTEPEAQGASIPSL
jgi:hypothetical protein